MTLSAFPSQADALLAHPSGAPFIECATPADLARLASRGKWTLARHLAVLNRYLLALAARRIKRLIVTMPPRHGKSSLISRYFPAWWLGTFPDERVILTSYGHSLAAFWSGRARDCLAEYGPRYFDVSVRGRGTAANWSIAGHEGGMIAAGVGGPIGGYGADLLICDDLIKNAEEADSMVMRDKVWDWLNSTAYTRLHPNAVVIIVHTRWNEDDAIGRTIREMDDDPTSERWTVLNLPAIAEEDESPFPLSLGRRRGEALWPQRYNLHALNNIRVKLTGRWWAALYQQRPAPEGGDFFQETWFPLILNHPAFLASCRYWDLAATEKTKANQDPDYTAGCLMSRGIDHLYYIRDMRHFRGSPAKVMDLICSTALTDGKDVQIVIEQEGGASGKIVIDDIIRHFHRLGIGPFTILADPVQAKGAKVRRAEPLAAAAEHGFVKCIRDHWNYKSFIAELVVFPNGAHDDQVDAASGAYSKLFKKVGAQPATGQGYSQEILDYGSNAAGLNRR